MQALCYFPAAFAGFIIVEVTDTLGFSGHLTIKVVRMLVRYIQRRWDIFPLVKSVCRGQVILGAGLGCPGFFPIFLGLSIILGADLGPHVVGQRG